ncbi:hypothetical protein BpHYR1_003267 [Brachionus plicatilis]|uniref:Uncharacterized protein n=1 Tax=Brachionus plicatilis TaxID=10195 RepID=A0A3M7PG71_BRAPC|nr:hypothetical protein BpHYR1_003267 [Brachionus plicatilis]
MLGFRSNGLIQIGLIKSINQEKLELVWNSNQRTFTKNLRIEDVKLVKNQYFAHKTFVAVVILKVQHSCLRLKYDC